MIGIGEGLTFLGACLIGSVSVFKYKKNGNVSKSLCDERSESIKEAMAEIKKTQIRIFNRIDDLVKM